MDEYRLPTVGGRQLLIRPCRTASRPQVQIAVISTHANIIEAVTIEAGDVLGLARAAGKIAREAHRLFKDEQAAAKADVDARVLRARQRNPWQTLDLAELKRKGLV